MYAKSAQQRERERTRKLEADKQKRLSSSIYHLGDKAYLAAPECAAARCLAQD